MNAPLELPEDLARLFADGPELLCRAALEALALEGVRSGKLTSAQAQRLLGLKSRYEMDGFLKEHGILLALSLDDVRREGEAALSFSR